MFLYFKIFQTVQLKHDSAHRSEIEGRMYLEQAIFNEKTDRTSLVEDSVANNLENASKLDASIGTSKQSEL